MAKTRMGKGACIGGIAQDGRSVRLVPADADPHDGANREYEVGEVWEVETRPAPEVTPPHVENVLVHDKRKLRMHEDPASIIERFMPAKHGGPEVLYEGLTQHTPAGALYIAEASGIPPYSTMFWRPDKPLIRDTDGKRIRYRYPTEEGGRMLTFTGFQEPVEMLPAGTLLRVSLAHWWRPKEEPEGEYRCFAQLSGWFLEDTSRPATSPARSSDVDASPTLSPVALEARLRTTFGYDTFRPLQREIIENILQRRDTLIIMPTGGGKSLCYQLPALLFDGLTVVVSPLISLMQDQVVQLRQLGVPATYLNSTLSLHEYVATTNRIRRGEVKLLYVAPETLLRPETLVLLEECHLECLAIDEAHCISQWGHDFRPEYRQIISVRERFPHAVCIALTATATPRVQQDIEQTMKFRDENEFLASFDRENLFISVEPKTNAVAQTLDFIAAHPGQSGIIYCATRRQVESVQVTLVEHGISALPYHAGLEAEVRQQNQTAFIRDNVPIMVATIAFGMGIDKPDIRFVLHVDVPESTEHYYQEIGRAGRDGLRADCLMLFSFGDVSTIRHFILQGAESELAGRKARLQGFIDWIVSDECRRRGLLAYFGEIYEQDHCAMCDNCLSKDAEQVDLTIPAQKFLSCVVRTRQAFGIAHVIRVLRGSRSRAILAWKHDQLSTHGIGREYSESEWKHLAQQFLQKGLLTRHSEHGTVQLTDKGWTVLKGDAVWGKPIGIRTAQVTGESIIHDAVLFEILRSKRKELADAADVPPYVIFSDRTLREMATYLPHSADTLGQTHGVGEVKLVRYADTFLPLIRDYCREHGLTEKPRQVAVPSKWSSIKKSRTEEVAERFQAGKSVADLMEVYGVKRQTILSHLEKHVQKGHSLPVGRLRAESELDPDVQQSVLDAFDEQGTDALSPLFTMFDGTVSYDELCLMRAIYHSR